MNDTRMLVGSLSNDLFRVANLAQRGSNEAASRFAREAKRWATPLLERETHPYIKKIAADVAKQKEDKISIELAEKYLMYGILLQNYALYI
ncbi:hypothetical protein C4564_05725 [Candidatus Microgenomates bacterium]|nr:MAG: hypothetical protein C4564_05725 [Candidatus Microgenomates bacterium]